VSQIHPLALVSPNAAIGKNVDIGPFCVVESDVKIGDGCVLASRVTLKCGTTLGPNNDVCEGAILGGRPQHKRAGNQIGELHIGSGNTIHENVTIHRALHPGEATVIGDHNLIMVNAHIAHDCRVGNHTIMANNVMLAGHVTVGNNAYLSGAAGIHQFCRVGEYAMVGGQAHISQDIPPFVTVDGQSSRVVGLNIVGLRRAGFSSADIAQLKQAYRVIYRGGMTWAETLQKLAETFHDGPATQFRSFMSAGKRGFVQERRVPRNAILSFPRPDELRDSDAPPMKILNVG
jgi:UDP-N-acetylglucosamine acyltransferase